MTYIDRNSVETDMTRININALRDEPFLQDFVLFCKSCNIQFVDEISNTIYIAYRTQKGLDTEKMRRIKNSVFGLAHQIIDEAPNMGENTKTTIDRKAEKHTLILSEKKIESDKADCKAMTSIVSQVETKHEKKVICEENLQGEKYSGEDKNLQYNSKYAYINFISIPKCEAKALIVDEDTTFKAITIESLRLSNRFTHSLQYMGVDYLYQLMELSVNDFKNLGGVGSKSINEFLEVKKKYGKEYASISKIVLPSSEYSKKTIYKYVLNKLELATDVTTLDEIEWIQSETFAKRLDSCIDNLGIDLCQKLWQSNESLTEWIIPLFAEISHEADFIKKKAELSAKICALDSMVLSAPTKSMLKAYCEINSISEKIKFAIEYSLIDCQTIFDVKRMRIALNENNCTAIFAFIDWLSFNICEMAVNLINECINKKKGALAVLDLRSQGYTLEAIAKQKKQTRERVRQLESYAVKVCNSVYDKYHLIRIISALQNDNTIITEQEVLDVVHLEAGSILLYLLKNIETDEFVYDKDAFVFRLSSANIDRSSIERDVEKLPTFVLENDWTLNLAQIATANNATNEYVEKIALLVYHKYDKYYAKGKISLKTMFGYILKTYYQNGIKLYDGAEYPYFRELVQKTFGEAKMPDNNHAMDSLIQRTAILFDRGAYIHPDNVRVDLDLISNIDQYIQDMPRTAISYAELYDIFEDELLLKTSINNRFYLQGVLKFFLNDKYYSTKDLISKDNRVKVDDELDQYVKQCQFVTRSDLLEHFKGLRESAICQMISRCHDIIGIDNAQYIHASTLSIKPEDYEIKEIITQNITSTPISARRLLDILYYTNSEFLERNDIDSHTKLFGIMYYMFSEFFSFSRPFIAKIGTKNVTNASVLLSLLDGYDSIEIEELLSICTDNKIPFLSINYLVSCISDEYIRISKEELMLCDNLKISDSNVVNIKNQLVADAAQKGYCSLPAIKDYLFYPNLGIKWTPFLLRSILQKYDDEFMLVDIPTSDSYLMATIAVDITTKLETYEELMEFITKKENSRNAFHTIQELTDWYKAEGLILSDIPTVIVNSSWLTLNNDGTINIVEKDKTNV